MKWNEKDNGRFGWEIAADGARIDEYPAQWGEPYVWHHLTGDHDCIKWSDGSREGFRQLDRMAGIEWTDTTHEPVLSPHDA